MEHMAILPGFFKPVRHSDRRRSSRQHIRDGVCLAALRAFTGAELYRAKEELTLGEAALKVGSNVDYIRAAVVLLELGDQVWIDRVLRGNCSILTAAASVEGFVKLVNAFKTASPGNLASFYTATGTADLSTPVKRMEVARKLGPETIWDDMIVPLVSNGR